MRSQASRLEGLVMKMSMKATKGVLRCIGGLVSMSLLVWPLAARAGVPISISAAGGASIATGNVRHYDRGWDAEASVGIEPVERW
jgi:hypothetical protein